MKAWQPDHAMRDPQHLLVLLGLVCQGLSFDHVLAPLAYAALWGLCLWLRRAPRRLPESIETVLTAAAVAVAYVAGARYGHNRLIFIGNGLVVFQALRLLRPLAVREQAYALAVALLHIAVGAQTTAHYGFIVVLLAALVLLPGALRALETARFRTPGGGGGTPGGATVALRRREHAALAGMAMVFFLLAPRFDVLRSANPLAMAGGGREPAASLDMSDGGGAGSEQIVFRIEGDDLGYIKALAFDRWDGRTWTASPFAFQAQRLAWARDVRGTRRRTVRLTSTGALGRILPSDGMVVRVEGAYLQNQAYVADHGGLLLHMGNTRGRTYDYWSMPTQRSPAPTAKDRRRHLDVTPPSPELARWLDSTVGPLAAAQDVALRLVRHFQENHEYRLGAPDLERLSPVDDFVLNRRAGHCERFASALAVLLRQRGIPARVAVGWLATERNAFGNFHNVRVRHGHAWTEAWIDGQGWVIFDATPYGRGIVFERRSAGLSLVEWLEYAWYSKVVEFSRSDQRRLGSTVLGGIQTAAATVARHLWLGILGMILAALAIVGREGHRLRRRWPGRHPRETERQRAFSEARHFYGRMLALLARRHLVRRPGQTPVEFLREVERAEHPAIDDIRELTHRFCDARYGDRPLGQDARKRVRDALRRLRRV